MPLQLVLKPKVPCPDSPNGQHKFDIDNPPDHRCTVCNKTPTEARKDTVDFITAMLAGAGVQPTKVVKP